MVAPDRVRLSWRLDGAGTGRVPRSQRAYQVLVTDDAGAVAWDSGRVEAAAAADVAYGGSPLTAGGLYRWKVRVWDEDDRASEWSDPARFEVEFDRTSGLHASGIARLGRAGLHSALWRLRRGLRLAAGPAA